MSSFWRRAHFVPQGGNWTSPLFFVRWPRRGVSVLLLVSFPTGLSVLCRFIASVAEVCQLLSRYGSASICKFASVWLPGTNVGANPM